MAIGRVDLRSLSRFARPQTKRPCGMSFIRTIEPAIYRGTIPDESAMRLEDITLALFAACNFIRLFAYLPQIYKAATDKNGASAISYTTWGVFLIANMSTSAYALVNRSDWWLAACFVCNAFCCLAILAVAYWKSISHARASQLSPKSSDRRRSLSDYVRQAILVRIGSTNVPSATVQGDRDATLIAGRTQS